MKEGERRADCAPGEGRWPSEAKAFESLPPEAPLAMPVQDFRTAPQSRLDGSKWSDIAVDSLTKRVLVLAVSLLPALVAAHIMNGSIGLDGFSAWEVAYLALFIPLFAWVAFGCTTAVIGFILMMSHEDAGLRPYRPRPSFQLQGKTAVLVPVCNEDFLAVLERLSIMDESLANVMGGRNFEFFILSDSNEKNGRVEEFLYRRRAKAFALPVHYRRRLENIERKPGNIAEWVRRFGGGYDYMLVLDADSVMGGQTIARLASDMERHPHLGLIQTVPSVAGASTLFSRWQQFANRLYGPISAAGMIWWARSEGTFWGHNALIRVTAFAESCGLPILNGPAPFGGHVMSHDMVEAALLRRRGWAVHMILADDSYEEFPPSIAELSKRDRRWCQGNIQHVPLLMRTAGLHMVNRFQLLVGASAYVTSPMWLTMILLVLAGEHFGAWTAGGVLPSGALLWITVAMLFGPKLLALIWAATDPMRRSSFGGNGAMARSVALEVILSILLAPVAMLTQTINLAGIMIGRKSPWNGQTRDRDGMGPFEAIWMFKYHILLGGALIAACSFTGMSMWWMSPIIAGLLLAPALAALTARKDLGQRAAKAGLFKVPNAWWEDARERKPKPAASTKKETKAYAKAANAN